MVHTYKATKPVALLVHLCKIKINNIFLTNIFLLKALVNKLFSCFSAVHIRNYLLRILYFRMLLISRVVTTMTSQQVCVL